jgi:acyl carrier protein
LFELGISSLALTEIHEQIDNAYPDLLDLDDLFEHPTVAELAELVKSKQ